MPAPIFTRRSWSIVLALGAIVLALSGCGSSSPRGKSGPDPASIVPASAPFYIGAVVTPDGSLKRDALGAAQKLTHLNNPYGSLLKALQSAGNTHFSWAEVKPWLGERAGLFITSIGASGSPLALLEGGLSKGLGAITAQSAFNRKETQGALVLDITDSSKARSFLSAHLAGGKTHKSTYKDISYQADSEEDAFAIIGHFAVLGSEAALKSVIDTFRGGASLAHAPTYTKLASQTKPDALVDIYASPGELLHSIRTSTKSDAESLLLARQLLGGTQQTYVSLTPEAQAISIDIDTLSSGSTSTSSTSGAEVLDGLPSGSWLAIGIGDFGTTAERALQGLKSLSSALGGTSLQGLLGPLSSNSAILRRDFLSWMGSAGIFASGNSLLDIGVAAVITSKSASSSRAAISKLPDLLRGSGATVKPISLAGTEAAATVTLKGLPFVLDVAAGQAADGQSEFVIGLGNTAVEQALSPSSTLSSEATYHTAIETLGEGIKPSVIIDFQTLSSVLEGINLQENKSLSQIVSYLRSLTGMTAGSERLGDITRSRIVLGLQ